jgi:hypothetical protein
MLVRVVGVALLVATPAGHAWLFATAVLFLGIGNQAWPAAHAALVATVAHGRERDAALAGGRALRNAGLGVGALLATACLAGGTTALQALAAVSGFGLAVSPAVITALASHGPAALWGSLAAATLLSATAVVTEKPQRTRLSGCCRRARVGKESPGPEGTVDCQSPVRRRHAGS